MEYQSNCDAQTWQLETIGFCHHEGHLYQKEWKGILENSAQIFAEKLERKRTRNSSYEGGWVFRNWPIRRAVESLSLSYCALSLFCSISLLCGHYNLEQEHKKRIHYNQIDRQSWKHHRIQNQSVSWAGVVHSLLFPFLTGEIKSQIYLLSYL